MKVERLVPPAGVDGEETWSLREDSEEVDRLSGV